MKSKLYRSIVVASVVALAALPAHGDSAGNWDEETLELFSSLPILDGGRIKPLDTFASIQLLSLNGKRTYNTEGGGRSTPIEWFLDCLFYPEQAKDFATFQVVDSNIITALGGEAHEHRSSRYSYNELMTIRTELFARAQEHAMIDDAERTPTQQLTLNLAHNINRFDLLIHHLDFAREDYTIHNEASALAKVYPPHEALTLSQIIAKGAVLRRAIERMREAEQQGVSNADDVAAFTNLFQSLDLVSNRAYALEMIPPSNLEDEEWLSPADLVGKIFDPDGPDKTELRALASLERLPKVLDQPMVFKHELNNLHGIVVGQAQLRGEYDMIPLERTYYKSKVIFYAQWLFVVSCILVALSWLVLRNRVLHALSIGSVLLPWTLLVIGITMRCIIQGRPPVTTLYEGVLFITATGIVVALFIEYANRERVALAAAALIGAFGMFIANRYELSNKQDTMPSLVAVLDTNFWLATHVTIVTIGYSAGLLAGAIAHVFILGKLFGFRKDDKAFYKNVTRMVYGVICFGLICSFIGTVLGGIWANYSWGRFWGWDPKENGALMIVLCNLAIIHARLGGYIRQVGIHISAIFAGCVVAFSMWGVNLLGVGLHSYGFTSGIWGALRTFWGFETFIMALGAVVYFRERARKASAQLGGRSSV